MIAVGDIIHDRGAELVVTYVAIASGYNKNAKRHFEFTVIAVKPMPARSSR